MLGNFSYCNPTKLYFGEDSLNYLNEELPKYGKTVFEDAGVMPNPTVQKLGLVMNISDLGVTEDMLDGLSKSTLLMEGGYKVLTHDEIVEVFKASVRSENGR